jgi:hypothetical protein
MRQYWKPLIFALAVALVVLLPDAESRILQIIKSAGLLLTLVRGMVAYYNDFLVVMEAKKRSEVRH